jgi:hypothetical protein
MRTAEIPVDEIGDWDSFHTVFARVLGFPSYYGRNMDAWIDCLTYADDQTAQMIADEFVVSPGEVLALNLGVLGDFPQRCPEQFDALNDCAAFVN